MDSEAMITDSSNQGQIFEYSASNIWAHLVKPKPDFLNIRQTRIEVLEGKYSIFPSLHKSLMQYCISFSTLK